MDGPNLYAYCKNNPVYYVDPSGNICDSVAQRIIDKFSMDGNFNASRNEQKKLAAYLCNKDRNGTSLTLMETRILNQINDYTYLPTYGQDVPSHIYKRGNVDKWHRENGQFALNAEMGIQTNEPSNFDSLHGNSLNDPRINYAYALVDKDTKETLKFGESIYPNTRYFQKYLNENNSLMKIMESGNKRDIHIWQHAMNEYYRTIYGVYPSLSVKGW